MIRNVSQLTCVCYLDGNSSDMGYKFTISAGFGIGYVAFRQYKSLRRFMDIYGLCIDKSTVQTHDYRSHGRGRIMTFAFMPRNIRDVYFWDYSELPNGAFPFVGLENGSYVTLFAHNTADGVTIYRPNPNAKSVYLPLDYVKCQKQFG